MEAHELLIGARHGWGKDLPASLSVADRRFHTAVIGKSGSGKSTLLKNLIVQEIALGHGVAVIDPHGDLATDVLASIPTSRTDHVVYLNPSDEEFPAAFNPLAEKLKPSLSASTIVAAFKHIWKDSWGPRLEYILYATVAALIECPNTSFLGITKMLNSREYRRWVVAQVKDPMVRDFFIHEFERYDPKFMREAVAPIQNKVGQLLMAPSVRNILGQVKNKIDFRFILDDSRIFIANLSKGLMGEDKSSLLGALLVSQFQIAALSRASVDSSKRPTFSLFVDEYPNFCSENFASILSEARKFGLNVTLANQYLAQVPPTTLEAVFGNVGNLIVFQVGSADAERISGEFGGSIPPSNFVNLNKFEAYVRSARNGEAETPYLVKTAPAILPKSQKTERLINRSRERFTTRRMDVERKLVGWLKEDSEETSKSRRNR